MEPGFTTLKFRALYRSLHFEKKNELDKCK